MTPAAPAWPWLARHARVAAIAAVALGATILAWLVEPLSLTVALGLWMAVVMAGLALTEDLAFVEKDTPAPADLRALVEALDDGPTIEALIALGIAQGGWQRRQITIGALAEHTRMADRPPEDVDPQASLHQYLLRARATTRSPLRQ